MARHHHLAVGVALFLALACKGEAGTRPGDAAQADPAGAGDPAVATGEVDANDPDALRRAAIDLFESGRRDEAIPLFERVAALRPDVRAWLDLGLVYGAVARVDDAEAAYMRLLELQPRHPVALHNLGNLETKRGRDAEAVTWYRRAIEARPDYLLAWSHLGDAYRRSGDPRAAYKAYERSLTIEPTDGAELAAYDESMYQMASLDLQHGAPERAKLILEELLRGNPRHAKAYYAYGRLLLEAGMPDEAQAAFDRHMEILAASEPVGPAAMDR